MTGNMPESIRALLLKQNSTALSAAESQQLNEWYEALDLGPEENPLAESNSAEAEQELIWEGLQQRMEEAAPSRVYRLKPWMWKAAAVALLAGLAAGWLWYQQRPYPMEVATNIGRIKHITLPDGSQVWLNAKSKLQYANWGPDKPREVILTGEAFFDVAQQAKQPFIIHTQTVDIRVLGTSFNVKAYGEDGNTETTLVTGKVQVVMKQEEGKIVELKPSEKLVVSNSRDIKQIETIKTHNKQTPDSVAYHISPVSITPGDNMPAEISWKERKLTFFDAPLSEVAMQLQRWYGVTVVFKEETMKNTRFTGTFRDESLPRVMQVLQMSAPFSYHINNDTLSISK